MDDQLGEVEHPEFQVPILPRLSLMQTATPESTSSSLKVGVYRLRLDALGQPVPHDLTGSVEFDYQM